MKPNRHEIAARANQLWEEGGCQPGRDLDYWLQAETELCAASGNNPQSPADSPAQSTPPARHTPKLLPAATGPKVQPSKAKTTPMAARGSPRA